MALVAAGSSGNAVPMVVVAGAPFGELDLADAGGLSSDEVLSRLGSGPGGLSSDDVADRLRQFGPNALGTHRVRAGAVLFRQIRNPILILLLGAALVSGLTGGGTNAVIIAVIVALSVGLGFINEYRAEAAMASLRGKIRHEAEVLRDGRTCRVPVANLVPGDVVSLRIGALVPADLRLLKVDELECDEGVLTGESMPVAKSVAPVADRRALDQPGCAFMGTIVHQGSALGVVVRSGARTAFGQIAAGLAEKQGQTAFEAGLSRFSRFLFGVAAVLTAFIFIVNVALSRPIIDALLFSAHEQWPETTGTGTDDGYQRVPNRRSRASDRAPNAECRMPNAECRMPNAECRMPNAEHRMPRQNDDGRHPGRSAERHVRCSRALQATGVGRHEVRSKPAVLGG